MARLDPTARVRRHIAEVLADGPVAFDKVLAALMARDLELGPDPEERLDDVLETMASVTWLQLRDPGDTAEVTELWFDRRALIDGTTWTVPISEVDLRSDTLRFDSMGLLFMALMNEWCTLDGGGNIDVDLEDRRLSASAATGVEADDAFDGVTFPEGWLADHGARAGGYLLLRLEGETVQGRDADEPPQPSPALIDALVGTLEPEPSPDACRYLTEVLIEAFVTNPQLRGAEVPPLPHLIEAAGLAVDRSLVARTGFDFERERLRRRVDESVEALGLREPEAMGYTALMVAWTEWSTAPDRPVPELLEAAARALDLVPVAAGFVDEEVAPDDEDLDPDALARFGEALIEAVTGRHRAGSAWLVAQALGVAGQTGPFEDWIDTALSFDRDHVLALHDKAWFEFDRGEARKAKALLTRIGPRVAEHDLAILDGVLATAAGPAVGRNDPCPCGSGRKYKRCHLGVEEVSLQDRLTWLYRKANWWLERRHRPEVESLAFVRARSSGLPPERLLETDPSIVDAVLTEGGRFREWLDERGALLPADEALLAEQWALIERSVFEVTEVRPDEGLTVRDIRTGDVIDVQERRGTHGMTVGRYLLARPLPTGSGAHQFFGGIIIVPDPMRDRFIDLLDEGPGPTQLMLLVAEAEAPPSMVNRDGHDTVVCETTWEVVDAAVAARALDTTLEPSEEPGHWSWLEAADEDASDESAPGGRTVLGTVALDGDRLTGTTNSVERAEVMSQLVEGLLPDAELVERLESDLDEIRHDREYEEAVFGDDEEADEILSGLIDPTEAPPELQAMLRRQMDLHEEQWVDESIPALGGATPREALDDPTRRDDLFRLLDRMDEMDAGLPPDQRALGMRTSRLRELLGLPAVADLRLPDR